MNYTENYHLPQWDETDRILRTDFNQAMGNLENGLSQSRDEFRTRLEDGRQKAQNHFSGLDKGLFRLAYNHYCMMKETDPQPPQLGIFYCNPYDEYPGGTTQRDHALYMARSEGTPVESKNFFMSFTQTSQMNIVPGDLSACTPQVLSFYCPMPGAIVALLFSAVFRQAPVGTVSFLLKVKNTDTDRVEWVRQLDCPSKGTVSQQEFLQMSIPLHAKANYEMILEPTAAVGEGYAEIMYGATGNAIFFYKDFPGCSFTHTMRDFQESQGGMAIVRCKPGGTGGTVTFTWNGKKMEPTLIRDASAYGGEEIQEFIYIRNETLPTVNNFSVSFNCNMDGEFWFYDWGAILF